MGLGLRMGLGLLLFTLPVSEGTSALAQEYQVSGKIIDAGDGATVADVTVYINGTTIGATTDQQGSFQLDGVDLPCELIISHVSYKLQRIRLQDPGLLEDLRFVLEQKVVLLEEVTVIHETLREDYLRRFKEWFLGVDYNKYHAEILNDSILAFNVLDNDQFTVNAREPILIHLPATGYHLMVDLVKFELLFKEELKAYHCSILGYFYFNPIDPANPRKQRTIARNRTEHYYNSRMHFCRSLYHNQLAVNGYLFESNCQSVEDDPTGTEFIYDMKAFYGRDAYGNQQLMLTDFNCREFSISFNYNVRNRPVDLTYLDSNPARVEWSGLRFLQDTIRIYPSGRTPENSILFSNSIALKGIASMLPEDYIPSMQ